METKKPPKMPFGKTKFSMPTDIRSCCSSFMAKKEQDGSFPEWMEQLKSCCGMAEMMAEGGDNSSPDQKESDSETTESSKDN